MKHLKTFNESNSKWSRISSKNPQLSRFSGKTFPTILYSDNKIYARDDNGKNASVSLETDNISLEGVYGILTRISQPHPSKEDIDWFLNQIELVRQPIAKTGIYDN